MPFELISEEAPAPEQESYLSQGLRGVARTASRVGERIAGAPGDIFSLINDFAAKPIVEFATGKPGVPYEKTQLSKVFPTSEQHQKATTSKFGKYIEPQSNVEKFIDNVVSEGTSYAVPGLRQGKLGQKALKSLAISTAANTVGSVTEDITKDETKANLAKFGSLFMLSLMDKPKAAEAVGKLYKPLSEKVTSLKPVNASGLEFSLSNLQKKMTKGTLAPSEKFIFDESGSILSKIKNGKIEPEELWAVKRSLNEKLSKMLFDIPKKSDQARARKLAKGILHEVDNTLKLTAKQDPTFYKDLKSADKAFGVIAESNFISNWVEKHAKYTPVTHGFVELFKGLTGSSVGTAFLPYQVGKILYRISKSPVLAKHYAKTLGAAAAQDSVVMNKHLRDLDKEYQKQEKKDKFILVE